MITYALRLARQLLYPLLIGAAFGAATASSAPLAPDKLTVPTGFRIELLTDAVPNARAMTLGRYADGRGVVYVGSMREGKVYAVEIGGAAPAKVRVIASGLELPLGVAYRNNQLYVSALTRILRFDGIDNSLDKPPAAQTVLDGLPSETHHGGKYIAFGPDGKLYFAVGAPCNVCVPDEAHGNLQRVDADGRNVEVIARGVRNSVGFDWNPRDGTLWFTDNGRDMLGDDVPSDELNRLQRPGASFGFPYCHEGRIADPQFGGQRPCSEFVAPMARLGAHVASLGMRFYGGAMFPADYRGNVFVAEHGSWNRTRKSGYRVVRVVLDAGGNVMRDEPFVSGWLSVDASGREAVHGRPADVLVLPDGSLLISDDLGGAIYRVSR